MIQRILAVVGLTVLLGGFQNCAETTFSSTNPDVSLKSSSALAAIDMDPADVDQNDNAGGSVSQPGDNGKKDENPAPPPPPGGATDDSASHDDDSDDSSSQDDDGLVACILVDHGKSLKLGLVSESLDGVNAVSQSVCISVKACTEIVPQLFEVEGPYERGYCKGNPNVKRLTDAEVQALVDKALAK